VIVGTLFRGNVKHQCLSRLSLHRIIVQQFFTTGTEDFLLSTPSRNREDILLVTYSLLSRHPSAVPKMSVIITQGSSATTTAKGNSTTITITGKSVKDGEAHPTHHHGGQYILRQRDLHQEMGLTFREPTLRRRMLTILLLVLRRIPCDAAITTILNQQVSNKDQGIYLPSSCLQPSAPRLPFLWVEKKSSSLLEMGNRIFTEPSHFPILPLGVLDGPITFRRAHIISRGD